TEASTQNKKEVGIGFDDNDGKNVEVQNHSIVSVGGESLSSDSFKYKFAYKRRGRTVGEFFFKDFCSTPSYARKIGPLPTLELLTPSPTVVSAYSITSTVDTGAIVTEEISAKDISVTYNAIGDHSNHVDEGVSVSSPKDGQLIVADAGATGSILEALEGDQTNKIQNDDDVPSKKSSEHTPSPQDFGLTGDFGESLPVVTPLKVQRPHDDGSYSFIDRSAQKSIENYSSTDEDIKNELGEEVEKNVMEDVGSTKMEQVSVHNEEKEIADDKNQLKAKSTKGIDSYKDLPVANCDIIVLRTLQLQRNKYLAELSDQERILAKFSLLLRNYINWLIDERKKKEYIESIIAEKEIDLEKAKDNPCYDTIKAECLKDKQKTTYRESIFVPVHIGNHFTVLVFNIQKSMIEDIDNRSDNKSFAIYGEKPYDKVYELVIESSVVVLMVFTIGIEGLFLLLVEVIKMTLIVVFIELKLCNGMTIGMRKSIRLLHFQQYAYTKNLSRCHLAIDLVSYKENRRKQEVFKECALWSARKAFLIQQQKKRKDKEKHLENLRVKRVEKVFVEDEKIKKERERHEQ
ncbi:Zinc finger CCCH domain-containing protein 22, partial [Bienertia sinuspersici]